MTNDYHGERNMNLNENYSQEISSSRCTVNKKTHKNSHLINVWCFKMTS